MMQRIKGGWAAKYPWLFKIAIVLVVCRRICESYVVIFSPDLTELN